MSKRIFKDEQIRLIMECRQSGLTDYQWCKQNGIHPGNFYNWVSKLQKQGYTFTESAAKPTAVTAELLIGGITLRLFNGADEKLVQNTLRFIGGMNHVW